MMKIKLYVLFTITGSLPQSAQLHGMPRGQKKTNDMANHLHIVKDNYVIY